MNPEIVKLKEDVTRPNQEITRSTYSPQKSDYPNLSPLMAVTQLHRSFNSTPVLTRENQSAPHVLPTLALFTPSTDSFQLVSKKEKVQPNVHQDINFRDEIARFYKGWCFFFIRYGNCNNASCNRIHSPQFRSSFQQELNRRMIAAHDEIIATGFSTQYCLYFKHNCCTNSNCPKSHRIPPSNAEQKVSSDSNQKNPQKYLDSAFKSPAN